MLKLPHEKFLLTLILFSLFLLGSTGNGISGESSLKKATLSLQWLTQCQFAGYFVALEKGWYREEGIDLTITPGASDINPIPLVSSNVAEFGTKWLADLLAAIDKGVPVISIAQIVQKNGLVLLSKTESGIRTPHDFSGKNLGIWFFGNETQFYAMMNHLNIPINSFRVKPLKWSIQPFLNGEFDVITAMTYNEYLKVLDSGYTKQQITIIDFSDYGFNFPGQVLFTKRSTLQTDKGLCRKIVRASIRGWRWSMEHPEEAVDIVLKHDQTKMLDKPHQLNQMKEMTRLIHYGNRPLGYHDPEQVRFVMEKLYQNNVISKPVDLTNVYTNAIWETSQTGDSN